MSYYRKSSIHSPTSFARNIHSSQHPQNSCPSTMKMGTRDVEDLPTLYQPLIPPAPYRIHRRNDYHAIAFAWRCNEPVDTAVNLGYHACTWCTAHANPKHEKNGCIERGRVRRYKTHSLANRINVRILTIIVSIFGSMYFFSPTNHAVQLGGPFE